MYFPDINAFEPHNTQKIFVYKWNQLQQHKLNDLITQTFFNILLFVQKTAGK